MKLIRNVMRAACLLLAAATGSWAWGATASAVWEGDFTTTVEGYTLNLNSNTASDGVVTIDQTKGIQIDFTTAVAGETIFFKASNLTVDSTQRMLAASIATSDTTNDRTGVSVKDSKTSGRWGTGDFNTSATQTDIASHTEEKLYAFTYSNAGTYLYTIADGARTQIYGCAVLMAGADTTGTKISGACIAGSRTAAISAETGLKISAIAVFTSVLSESDMTSYKWPSEIGYEATVSSSCNWSEIDFGDETTWSSVDKTKTVSVTIESGVSVTLDTDITMNGGDLVVSGAGTLAVDTTEERTITADASIISIVSIPSSATLRTKGTIKLGETSSTAITGNLYVDSGTTTLYAPHQGIKAGARIYVAKDATLVSGSGDLTPYATSDIQVHVRGTLDFGSNRWTIQASTIIYAYAGATIKGAGDQWGAMDPNSKTDQLIIVSNEDGSGTVTCSAPIRGRAACKIEVQEGMVFNYMTTVNNGSNQNNKLTKTGAGTMNLSGNSNPTGGWSVEEGTLCLKNGVTVAGTIAISSGATLALDPGESTTIALPTYSGEGSITLLSGTLKITIADQMTSTTYSNITIASGTTVKFVLSDGTELSTVTATEDDTVPTYTAPTMSEKLYFTSTYVNGFNDSRAVKTWFTAFGGEGFSTGNLFMLGPDGSSMCPTVQSGAHPYYALGAKSAYTMALYADISDVDATTPAVIFSVGNTSTHHAIVKTSDGVALYTNGVATTVSKSGTFKGWHLYALVYDSTTTSLALFVDGTKVGSVTDATTPADGMQIGSVFQGLPSAYAKGIDMSCAAFIGYELALSDTQVAALSTTSWYPAIETPSGSSEVATTSTISKLRIHDATMGKLTIASGTEVTITGTVSAYLTKTSLAGTLTIAEGASFTDTSTEGDAFPYTNASSVLNVYGTMDFGSKRQSFPQGGTLNFYGGSTIKGEGDGNSSYDAAIEFINGANNNTHFIANGDNKTVTLAALMGIRAACTCTWTIDSGVTVNWSGNTDGECVNKSSSSAKIALVGGGTLNATGSFAVAPAFEIGLGTTLKIASTYTGTITAATGCTLNTDTTSEDGVTIYTATHTPTSVYYKSGYFGASNDDPFTVTSDGETTTALLTGDTLIIDDKSSSVSTIWVAATLPDNMSKIEINRDTTFNAGEDNMTILGGCSIKLAAGVTMTLASSYHTTTMASDAVITTVENYHVVTNSASYVSTHDTATLAIPTVAGMTVTAVDGDGQSVTITDGTVTVATGSKLVVTYSPATGYAGTTQTVTIDSVSESSTVDTSDITAPVVGVAKIGDTYYATVSAALTAAGENDTVEVIATTEEDITVGASKTLTIDEGVTLTLGGGTSGGNTVRSVGSGATINVKGTLDFGYVRWDNSESYTMNVYAGATLQGTGNAESGCSACGPDFVNAPVTVNVLVNDSVDSTAATWNIATRVRTASTINVAEGVTLNMSGNIVTASWAAKATLTKSGAGTLNFTGTNSAGGSFNLAAGTITSTSALTVTTEVENNVVTETEASGVYTYALEEVLIDFPVNFTKTVTGSTATAWGCPLDCTTNDTELTIVAKPITFTDESQTSTHVAVTVLVDIPTTIPSGDLISIGIEKTDGTASQIINLHSDGTNFKQGYTDTYGYGSCAAVSGLHTITFYYNVDGTAKTYIDGVLAASSTGLGFGGRVIRSVIAVGARTDATNAMAGLKVRAVKIDYTTTDATAIQEAASSVIDAQYSFKTPSGDDADVSDFSTEDKMTLVKALADSDGVVTLPSYTNGGTAVTSASGIIEMFNLTGSTAGGEVKGSLTSFSQNSSGNLEIGVTLPTAYNGTKANAVLTMKTAAKGLVKRVSIQGKSTSTGLTFEIDPATLLADSNVAYFSFQGEVSDTTLTTGAALQAADASPNFSSTALVSSSTVGGGLELLDFTLSGGLASDFESDAVKSVTFTLTGDAVAAGTSMTLTIGDTSYTAEVADDKTVTFTGLSGLANGSVLSLKTTSAVAASTSATSAGVSTMAWGDGTTTTVDQTADVLTMLANKPNADFTGVGSDSGMYRIPAYATDMAGHMIAIYDCRYINGKDVGQDDSGCIDGAGNYGTWDSSTGTVTWKAPQVMIDVPNVLSADGSGRAIVARNSTNGVEYAKYDVGDPSIVYDQTNKKFVSMWMTGGGLMGYISQYDGTNASDVVIYTRGVNESDTWGNRTSVKHAITNALATADSNIPVFDSVTNYNAMAYGGPSRGILEGPGAAICTRVAVDLDNDGTVDVPQGTIVFPMQYFHNTASSGSIWGRGFCAWANNTTESDVSKWTWKATGLTGSPIEGANNNSDEEEANVTQLDDGSLYMIAKHGTSRWLGRSTDWSTWTRVGYLTSQKVQGSIIRIGKQWDDEAKTSSHSVYVAAMPTGSDRSNITMYIGQDVSAKTSDSTYNVTGSKYDGSTQTTSEVTINKGIDWDTTNTVSIFPATTTNKGYTSMDMLDKTHLSIVFEANSHIYFKILDISAYVDSTIEQ